MSSSDSNSSSPTPPPPVEEKPRSSAALVALTLALLAGMVWTMLPARSKLQPAPLSPVPSGCPIVIPNFVPSDATEVPGADLAGLSQAQRNHVLFRLNMEPCPCGCNLSIAACRIGHAVCPLAQGMVEKILAEERQGSKGLSGK